MTGHGGPPAKVGMTTRVPESRVGARPGIPPPPADYPLDYPPLYPYRRNSGRPAGGYGPPPPGAYYPPPDYRGGWGPGQPVSRAGTNGLAIASLITSFAGFLCCVGSIVAIVLGTVALDQIKRTRQEGYGMAVAGIVLGVAGLVVALIIGSSRCILVRRTARCVAPAAAYALNHGLGKPGVCGAPAPDVGARSRGRILRARARCRGQYQHRSSATARPGAGRRLGDPPQNLHPDTAGRRDRARGRDTGHRQRVTAPVRAAARRSACAGSSA